jgi:hypothetical protein
MLAELKVADELCRRRAGRIKEGICNDFLLGELRDKESSRRYAWIDLEAGPKTISEITGCSKIMP